MALNKDFEDLLHLLNQEKVEYLIVGAYAVIFYTEPRYTKDIDIWVKPVPDNSEKVYRALKKFGAPVKNLSLKDLQNPEMAYQLGIGPNRIDILMGIKGLDFESAWKNKKITHYGDERVYILNLNDLMKAKKKANRPHDKIDLENLRKVKKSNESRTLKR